VSWKNAKAVADAWIHERMPDDLRGRAVQLVDFPDDETCRFFYNDRVIGLHRMVTTAIAREARKRGAKILHAQVTLADYERERLKRESPREFVERCHRFF
jgi:hypothetical protein